MWITLVGLINGTNENALTSLIDIGLACEVYCLQCNVMQCIATTNTMDNIEEPDISECIWQICILCVSGNDRSFQVGAAIQSMPPL